MSGNNAERTVRSLANEILDVLDKHEDADPVLKIRACQLAMSNLQQLHRVPLAQMLGAPSA
jgi:hypothetical protein